MATRRYGMVIVNATLKASTCAAVSGMPVAVTTAASCLPLCWRVVPVQIRNTIRPAVVDAALVSVRVSETSKAGSDATMIGASFVPWTVNTRNSSPPAMSRR